MKLTNSKSVEPESALKAFELANANGMKMKVTNFGGRIVALWVPDKNGNRANVVLGYNSLEEYLHGNPYFGAQIGRYGNRIAKGKFTLDGKTHQLARNNGENALHGGPRGFHNVPWEVTKITMNDHDALELTYFSSDGEEGYPGNFHVKVHYQLTDDNALTIDYKATTDAPTIVNLTHHSFFNLAGEGNESILDHRLMINANRFTPVGEGLIPTGELKEVKGTPFDFTSPHPIGARIDDKDQQLLLGKGYDHNWVLDKEDGSLTLAARLSEPQSGRVMEVWTTEPGLQFYSGNFLDDSDKGFGGKPYPLRSALCLEAQHFPDSPNHKNFPSTILKPGEVYSQKTIYRFSAEKK
jgi:aldose 1-epimerase